MADDTEALQAALDAACRGGRSLDVPAGTYNISEPLVAPCALSISGDGATLSIIQQTVQKSAHHGLVTAHSLTVRDLSIVTAPLSRDLGMAAVFRSDTAFPAEGQTFAFIRYSSSGFNFALDVAGTSETDQLGEVTVRDCDLSVTTSFGAVSQPVNIRTAASVRVEDNNLTGDGNNDHGIYLIAVRDVVLRRNRIAGIQNSAIKLLNGGFCGRTAGCAPDTVQDYSSWRIENNRIEKAALAIAVFLYGTTELPRLKISHNEIRDIVDDYASDAAAIYINVNDTAVMEDVSLTSNTYDRLSLGGIFLVTSGHGTVALFEDHQDQFLYWSVDYPGTYYAISSSGPGLKEAAIDRVFIDRRSSGRGALNLGAFSRVTEVDAKPGVNARPGIGAKP